MIDLLKLLSTPIVLIILFLTCGLILVADNRRRPRVKETGFFLIVIATLVLYLFSIKPVSNLLAYSLEAKYRPPSKEALSNLDIIVVLGGGFIPSGAFRKNPEASKGTYSRLFNGVEMFKQSSAKALVLSGACPWPSKESDALVMKELAIKLGLPEDLIITEAKARNTMEQAAELVKLFPPDRRMRIGIVTSAMHMLRAERAFVKKYPRNAITPLPVDYASCPPDYDFGIKIFIPSADNFSLSSFVIHELVGMIWYSLQGAV